MSLEHPILLYQFPPALGLPISESPPCAKVEAYLRLTRTPYELAVGDTRRSPNKMVPFVRWPRGHLQAESSEIIAALEPRAALNADLCPTRLLAGQELARQVEEVVYDACLYDRFVVVEGWRYQRPITRALIAHFLPTALLTPATALVRRQQIRRARRGVMRAPGTGYRIACLTIARVEALLADEPFLGGPRPATVDCAIWANLIHTAATPNDSPTRRTLRASSPLMDWLLRMGESAGWDVDPATIGRFL
ncbi:hypothetical protein DL240_18460 [Lujinxingia litoralis]|uniref:Thioredoxin-like fold domain-containing protein n=1 Tax=Lujinxingia litoralis TaxID=2211119 RepID=A0A328C328_9DELT|nr:hypothetical protein [Lujinxingia litoralis]RAL20201.1 hypothetical protein DL240_18460 [Lujinxingia litoralis]